MLNKDHETTSISISTGTIIKIILIILGLGFLYLIRDAVAIVFVAWVLASAIDPWVDWMQRKRLPRWLAILFIYLVLFGVIALIVYLVIPPVAHQFQQLSNDFPAYYDKLVNLFSKGGEQGQNLLSSLQGGLANISESVAGLSGGIFSAVASVFGGLFSFLLVLVITFYMTLGEDALKKFLKSIVPLKYQPYFITKAKRIQLKMGMWLRGQLVLSLIIGLLCYIGLLIIGVDYALVLGLVAAVTEFVPYLGPIIGAIPAVFLAFMGSPVKAVLVIVLYIIVQQLENGFISPKVMQKAVGLNPIVIVIALLVGGKVAGLIGVILAVPVATIISVFLEDFFESRKREDSRLEGLVGPEKETGEKVNGKK